MLFLSFSRLAARLASPLLATLALTCVSVSFASSPLDNLVGAPAAAAVPDENAFTVEAVTARRAALQLETAQARSRLEKIPENAADSTALALTQELGLLARLDGVFADQLRTLQHAADLAAEGAAITARTQNPRPPAERFPTPRGLARLDQLYAERDYLVRAKTLLEADLENAAAALADARDDLEDKDRQRRTAKEARPGAADGR
ncbi:MAG: hypothetical protein H7067_09945, partial [Burkholderiales bacterium]|nr:hypothetical protein [Opitutaceae bacterium]